MVNNGGRVFLILLVFLLEQTHRVSSPHEVHKLLVPVLECLIEDMEGFVFNLDTFVLEVGLDIFGNELDLLLDFELIHEHVEEQAHDTD